MLTRHILLGVQQILKQSILTPGNSSILVGCGVGEASSSAGDTAKQATQVRTLCGVERCTSVTRTQQFFAWFWVLSTMNASALYQ